MLIRATVGLAAWIAHPNKPGHSCGTKKNNTDRKPSKDPVGVKPDDAALPKKMIMMNRHRPIRS